MSLLCTKCKDEGLGEVPVFLYVDISKDFPPLTVSTEASTITAKDAIETYLQRHRERVTQEQSETGRGFRCRECDRRFTVDEDRWQPADELLDWRDPKTYRVKSINEELKNQRRVQADNAKVKMWIKGVRVR